LGWDPFPAPDDALLRPEAGPYPEPLRELSKPPRLWVRGCLPDAPAVAVVGSRRATEYGLGVAELLGHELGRAGITVVSGLAYGIDAAAHRGALASGGQTVAVLAGGIDRLYPLRHLALAGAIRRQGAVVSEEEPGTEPLPGYFPKRNRIIAALCAGVVIVEASDRSGALHTAEHALSLGREVLAVPGSIFSPTSRGTNALLAAGAKPLLSVQDVVANLATESLALGAPLPATLTTASPGRPRDNLARLLIRQLRDTPRHVDDLSAAAEAPLWQVAATLTRLELDGFAVSPSPGLFVRRRRPRPRPARPRRSSD
jgi:DNA processing protein